MRILCKVLLGVFLTISIVSVLTAPITGILAIVQGSGVLGGVAFISMLQAFIFFALVAFVGYLLDEVFTAPYASKKEHAEIVELKSKLKKAEELRDNALRMLKEERLANADYDFKEYDFHGA